jgi:hypothetical protein
MTTITPTIDSSQSPSMLPSISICISTPSPKFDLSLDTPFTITVTLTLHHHQSITFQPRDAPFFISPLGDPGLVFTNISTGEKDIGSKSYAHYLSSGDGGLPTEANRESWLTLLPGQPHTLDASIKPMGGKFRFRTIAEMESGSEVEFTTLKWPMVHRLLDGEMFDISVSEEARIRRWFVGELEEILNSRRSNMMPTVRNEVIEYELKETTKFKVKRPDRDGSLNWP